MQNKKKSFRVRVCASYSCWFNLPSWRVSCSCLSKFHLDDQEGVEIEISNTTTERLRCSKFFLVGKVLLRNAPRANVVMGMFMDLWHSKANVAAMAIGDNQILFCLGGSAVCSAWEYSVVFR